MELAGSDASPSDGQLEGSVGVPIGGDEVEDLLPEVGDALL